MSEPEKLQADGSVDGLCTRGAAYFNISELDRFAQSLVAFPLPEQLRLKISSGFFSKSNPPVLERGLVSMEFYRVGSRGQVGVRVHGETEIWRATESNLGTTPQSNFSPVRAARGFITGIDQTAGR